MKEYRRLSPRDSRRLRICGKPTVIITSIFVCLMAGVTCFYLYLDNKKVRTDNEICVWNAANNSDNSEAKEAEERKLEIDTMKSTLPIADSRPSSSDLPKKSEDDVLDTTQGCLKFDFSQWNKSCPRELVVVNGHNPVPENFKISTKVCRGKEIDIDVCKNLEDMISGAAKENIVLWISSGYRSLKYQENLFKNQVEREKNKCILTNEEAQRRAQKVVARAGMSEHNLGFAVDFNGVDDDFYKTKEYGWLVDHAADYGFIERYGKEWEEKTGVIFEPWHFRYVGVGSAKIIKDSGLCLEEYVVLNGGKGEKNQ